MQIGSLYTQQGNYAGASTMLEQARDLDPSAPEPYMALARLEEAQGKANEAIATLVKLMEDHREDVVVIAAPLGTHFQLATIALKAGADVYLEKPPLASLDDFRSLLQVQQETGQAVQVGFQSLGSRALQMLTEEALGIGALVRVSAGAEVGCASRRDSFGTRTGTPITSPEVWPLGAAG